LDKRQIAIFLGFAAVVLSTPAASASDWVEDDQTASMNAVYRPSNVIAPAEELSKISYAPPANAIGLSSLQLNFMQAMRALEHEIFGKDNAKHPVGDRLDLLEKTVFGTQTLPDLGNSFARLERLLAAVPLSLSSIQHVSPAQNGAVARRVDPPTGRSGVFNATKRLLSSPTFWELIGAAGVVFGAYELARYSATATSQVNPGDHYVNGYWRNGHFVHGYMATDPDDTMANNFSSVGNINPYTGSLGTIIPKY
jgi:hypothetical protein